MSRLLIISHNIDRASDIAAALHPVSRRISTCCSIREAAMLLRTQPFDAIIYVSEETYSWRVAVEQLNRAIASKPEMPQRFCVLSGPYNGVADRLYGKRIGWRVIHVPE